MSTIVLALTIIVEMGAGVLFAVGYKTKWAASALIVFTLLTIVIFHSNFADQNQVINALKNLAIIGGLFMYVIHGAGALSVDSKQTVPSQQV